MEPTRLAAVLLALLLPAVAAQPVAAQEGPGERVLVVGTKVADPFVVRGDDGVWSGISIDLWRAVAEDLGVTYEFRELALDELLAAVESGAVDVGVGALTITPEREATIDFSHPFYSAGLGIAVARGGARGWLATVRGLLSEQFVRVVLALLALLFAVGALVWLFERRHNPEEFGGRPAEGLGAAFWWSAVTMTTVGYGDKSPRSFGGRLVALVWMFAGVILISAFTAAITSALTVDRLETGVQGPEDLPRVRVGSLPATTSAAWLEQERITFSSFADARAGLAALAAGEIDALVYDAPLLRYLVKNTWPGELAVLEGTFRGQLYGFALPPESALREPLNRALLARLREPWWNEVRYRYLGE